MRVDGAEILAGDVVAVGVPGSVGACSGPRCPFAARDQNGLVDNANTDPVDEGAGAEVTAPAINVAVPEALRWTDIRRGETFLLTTLNVRLLPDGHLAAKAYGRPTAGGRGAYVSFPIPQNAELTQLIAEAADRAAALWAGNRGPA
jgi:hypothetical protein